jgi:hypothetical protein
VNAVSDALSPFGIRYLDVPPDAESVRRAVENSCLPA